MAAEELKDFRLVGGTALSLYLGHRISVDIDLFTDVKYGTIDFDAIETMLKKTFGYVAGEFGGNPGMGKSYLVGTDAESVIKVDLYYAMDPFFQDLFYEDGVRMATVEEIIAMKVDVVQRGGRKKDFWDLHELLSRYPITAMIDLHKQRFEWTHDGPLITNNFTDFADADNDLNPICLKGKEWVFIKEDIEAAVTDR
ncbi:nucleotidyl transferase AbiEii/AbiGii toxin family protein [Mucilaginibacter sp. UYCu711]|uniref:nucleotidyl transferase AbiEii/AbiGii toxin family protein n=1 Tax=Mucilaginibacter sp. UYCu711 TaxID=3156339 RepID=UPI003D2179CF